MDHFCLPKQIVWPICYPEIMPISLTICLPQFAKHHFLGFKRSIFIKMIFPATSREPEHITNEQLYNFLLLATEEMDQLCLTDFAAYFHLEDGTV
jgi:hypothetical protein